MALNHLAFVHTLVSWCISTTAWPWSAQIAFFVGYYLDPVVVLLTHLLLAMVAVMPFGLGFLILGPVTVCAIYASYREVFEETTRPAGIRLTK